MPFDRQFEILLLSSYAEPQANSTAYRKLGPAKNHQPGRANRAPAAKPDVRTLRRN